MNQLLSFVLTSLICSGSARRFNPSVAGSLNAQPADHDVRASEVSMNDLGGTQQRVRAADDTVFDDAIEFSWSNLGAGDIWTILGKLTGPASFKMDIATRKMEPQGNDNFDKFMGLLEGSDVAETLKGSGEYTLLAPVNTAIEKSKDPVDLKLHVLKGKHSLEDLKTGGEMETLAGTMVTVGKPLKIVKVNNAAVKGNFNPADHRGGKECTAFPYDVSCSNGVIHALDAVIKA